MTMPVLVPVLLSLAFQSTPRATASAKALLPPSTSRAHRAGTTADAAESFWKEWAEQHKYHFARSKDERVLLMLPEERAKPEHALALVEQTLAHADELFPVPDRPRDSEQVDGAAPAPAPEPKNGEDPASLPWGALQNELNGDTIVVALCRNPEDYATTLDHLGKSFSYLSAWIEKGKHDVGCVLVRPLFGACVDKVRGMEEWNPDNELVHRTAQLVAARGFGPQPVWLQLGVGWNVEFDVLKSIYCFPWRNSFVSVKEHGAWESSLKKMFARREKEPLAMAELTACRRGSFDVNEAALAWGTVRFLTHYRPGSLPKLLEECRVLRDKLGRVVTEGPDGYKSWTMAADFEVPAAEQQAALERAAGADVLPQLGAYFRLGEHGGYKGVAASR